MKTCVFAGTFDPVTLGHKNVIDKCLDRFERVILVIGQNPKKSTLFTEGQRLEMLKSVYGDNPKVEIALYSGHKDDYADFLKSKNATVYVRGIRNEQDLAFEKQMQQKNQVQYPFITTEFIHCDKDFCEISSTKVRQLVKDGNDCNAYLCPQVALLAKQYLKV